LDILKLFQQKVGCSSGGGGATRPLPRDGDVE